MKIIGFSRKKSVNRLSCRVSVILWSVKDQLKSPNVKICKEQRKISIQSVLYIENIYMISERRCILLMIFGQVWRLIRQNICK